MLSLNYLHKRNEWENYSDNQDEDLYILYVISEIWKIKSEKHTKFTQKIIIELKDSKLYKFSFYAVRESRKSNNVIVVKLGGLKSSYQGYISIAK